MDSDESEEERPGGGSGSEEELPDVEARYKKQRSGSKEDPDPEKN
jgi:hypothetical protein